MSTITTRTSVTDADVPTRSQHTRKTRQRAAGSRRTDLVAAVLLVSAVAIIVYVYGRARIDSDNSYYAVFWVGMGLAYITVLWRTWNERWSAGWLMLLGIITFVPKFVMSPTRPIYFDETAHFQLLRHVVEHGALFQHTPLLPIGTYYPGLQAVAASVHLVTGLTDWQSALVTVGLAHCGVPLVVYLCAREIVRTDRAAALAALVYMANPQFLYGDTQFAYESLGLVFMGACLLFYLRALRSTSHRQAGGYVALSVAAGFACIVTHHLTTLALSAILMVMACFWRSDRWILGGEVTGAGEPPVGAAPAGKAPVSTEDDGAYEAGTADPAAAVPVCGVDRSGALPAAPRPLVRLLPPVLVVGGFCLWVAFVAPSTLSYLSPHVTQPLRGLLAFFRGNQYTRLGHSTTKVAATRVAFAGSQIPRYEIWAGYGAPVVFVVVGLLGGLLWIRQRRVRRSYTWVYVLAMAYFASLPAVLLVGGAPGAHRSWATSFFPLGLLVAIVVVEGYRLLDHRVGRILVTAALLVVLIGDTAAGSAADYRFPGPYEFGSDTRSVTTQTISMARWVKEHLGEGAHIVTDRYTGLALVNVANAITPQTSGRLPVAAFWYDDYPPGPTLLRRMQHDGYDYVAVDLRSALYVPVEANLFYAGEPAVVPAQNLTRLTTWPWLDLLYRSTDYELFKINFSTYYQWYPSHAGEH